LPTSYDDSLASRRPSVPTFRVLHQCQQGMGGGLRESLVVDMGVNFDEAYSRIKVRFEGIEITAVRFRPAEQLACGVNGGNTARRHEERYVASGPVELLGRDPRPVRNTLPEWCASRSRWDCERKGTAPCSAWGPNRRPEVDHVDRARTHNVRHYLRRGLSFDKAGSGHERRAGRPSQVAFSKHDHMIQAITPGGSDQPLRVCPLPWDWPERKGPPQCSCLEFVRESYAHGFCADLGAGNAVTYLRETPPPFVALSTQQPDAPSR